MPEVNYLWRTLTDVRQRRADCSICPWSAVDPYVNGDQPEEHVKATGHTVVIRNTHTRILEAVSIQ